jgi:sugar (pentulose or hexulose) kinase
MSEDLVLTLDAGTGSLRALVYSIKKGETLAIASRDSIAHHPETHRAEFNPQEWWPIMLQVMREAVEHAGQPGSAYLGITATSLRQGFVLLDDVGESLCPGVLNYDRRGGVGIPKIEAQIDLQSLYNLTGHWHAPELTLPKLIWFMQERPEIWKKVKSVLFIHDWLLYRLCGEKGTNASLVCAGQMADVKKRAWAIDLLGRLGVSEEILPDVFEAGKIIGGLRADIAAHTGLNEGTPVHIGGGDTQFGVIGAGGLEAKTLVIVGGSTTPLMITTTEPVFDPLQHPWVSTHLPPGLWVLETNAGHTGMIYKWLRDLLRQSTTSEAKREESISFEQLNALAAESPPGANDLQVIASSPRWAQDTWERKAPYTIFGFNVAHSLGDLARAVMESVCYAVRGNLEQMERVSGESVERVIYTGGTTQSDLWTQMMADVLGRAINIPEEQEPAAVAGAQVVLRFKTEGTGMKPQPYRTLLPRNDFSTLYQPVYEAYVSLFERIQKNFTAE